MKKLIKADLSGILRLAEAYQAIEALNVEREVAELQRFRHTDYLFLTWNGRCRLSTLPAVYEPDTPANLDWLACRGVTPWPVVALYLHADKTVEGLPWGSVTLLDHRTAVEDVRIFSALPESQRERHIRLILRRYQRHVTYCSMLEAIQYLKTGGGESQWM